MYILYSSTTIATTILLLLLKFTDMITYSTICVSSVVKNIATVIGPFLKFKLNNPNSINV